MATVKSTLKGINRSSLTNNADLIECQELINLRFKEGKWRNVKSKVVQFGVEPGVSAMCVHNVSTSSIIVIYDKISGKLRYRKNLTFYNIYDLGNNRTVRFETVGNVLIVFDDTQKRMHYILWDLETSSYRYIGDATPRLIDINFSCLQRDYGTMPDDFHVFATNWTGYGASPYIPVGLMDYDVTYDERKAQVLSTMNIAYNKWEQSGEANGYVVIRYAYEMFDGSIVGHSAPILMHIRGKVTDKYSHTLNMAVAILNNNSRVYLGIDSGKLQYSIPTSSAEAIAELKSQYKGIIRSLNIYMSKVFHKYNDYNESKDSDSYVYGRRGGNNTPEPWEVSGIESDEVITPDLMIKDTQLYKIHSIPIDKLTIENNKPIELGDLTKIHTNDSLPSEQLSSLRLYSKSSFVYNSRVS